MSYELSRKIINGYRAWHSLEMDMAAAAQEAGTFDETRDWPAVIDIDVAPPSRKPVTYESRQEVQTAFEGFLDETHTRRLPNQEYIQRRLGASLLELRLRGGEEIGFYEQVSTAMSVMPELVDEEDIDDHRQRIDELLKPRGLRFVRSQKEKYEDMLVLAEDREALEERLLEAVDWAAEQLLIQSERNGEPITSVVPPRIVAADRGYTGYFGTKNHRPIMELNAHPRHRYTPAKMASVASRGTGHAQDYVGRAAAIRARDARLRIDPLLGVTTLHTPENTPATVYALGHEQIALRRMRCGGDTWQYRFQAEYNDYAEKVWNNAHIRINTGTSEAVVVRYLKKLLPFEEVESIEERMREMRDVPVIRGYNACYEPSMKIVRVILQQTPRRRAGLLEEVVRYPYSETGIRCFLPRDSKSASLAA